MGDPKTSLTRQAKKINIGVSALFCLAGFVMILFAGTLPDIAQRFILVFLCLICAAARILGYFSNDIYRLAFQFGLGFGIFTAIIGVLVFFENALMINNLAVVIGIYVIVDGLFKVQLAFDAKKFGFSNWIAMFCSAIVVTLVGITCLLAKIIPNVTNITVVGLALMADGGINIFITAATVKIRAMKKNCEDWLLDDVGYDALDEEHDDN